MIGFALLSILFLLFSLKKESKALLVISFVALFVIAGYREFHVGTDTKGYRMLFNRVKHGIEIRQELLFQYMNKVILFFDGDFSTYLVVSSLLVLVPVFLVVKKYSVNPMLSVFFYYTLYIYFFSMNITRQAIAMGFVLWAITFLARKKTWWFLALVCIAAGFHTTALSALLLLFAYKLPDKRDNLYYLISAITIGVGILLSGFIFRTAGNIFGYLNYVDSFELGTMLGNFLYLLILNAFLFFIMTNAKERGFFFKMFFIFVMATNLLVRIPFGDRVVLYYALIQIIYLPYFIYNNKFKTNDLAALVVILYTYVMFFLKFGAGGIMPYENTLF